MCAWVSEQIQDVARRDYNPRKIALPRLTKYLRPQREIPIILSRPKNVARGKKIAPLQI
jgi:hypothetical protein